MIAFFNAVNTFTDASIVKSECGDFITCAGYITTFHGEVIDSGTRIFYDSTNNYGEIMAIYMGVQNLLSYKGYDTFLNLFSDSEISVVGLKKWIYKWANDSRDNILYNSSGEMVVNQEWFRNIVGYIVSSNTHLSLYHQRGHKDPSNVDDLELVKNTFSKINGEEVNDDIVRYICYYNNLVDNLTRDTLIKETSEQRIEVLQSRFKRPMHLARRVLNPTMLERYKELIGG